MLGGTTMPLKKSMQDAVDKEIFLTPGTQVFTSIHELAVTYEDSVSVMAKSIGSFIGTNDGIDNCTPKTKSQNSLCQFGTFESNIANYV